MSEENKTIAPDPREIMNDIFARTSADQKKLLNNWCRTTHGTALQIWTRQVDLSSPELRQFLVEVDKALESGNWAFFDPDEHNPSDGQAVETTPQPSNPDTDEPEPEDEDEVIPEQDGRGVPTNRIAQHEEEAEEEEEIPAPVNAESVQTVPVPPPAPQADPFAGLVDAITQRVISSLEQRGIDTSVGNGALNDAIDKRIQNGAFPVKRVIELIDERYAHSIASFLRSQPSEVVDRALEIYDEEA